MKPLTAADPATIAGYELLGILGGGGMGRVYLARSRAGRRLAIKVIRAELAEDSAYRRRFAREVAAARLVSPLYTAAVVDADPDAEEPWLATVYIDGPSLQTWVTDKGAMPPAAVQIMAAGLAEALASMHAAGVVHRDLKPSNIVLDEAGPHLVDFGLALPSDSSAITTGLLGTPAYMSPERLHGGNPGPAGDIFALGATLYFAATGQRMVSEGDVFAQIVQISTSRFDFSAVPTELRQLIERCVSHQAKDRPTAEELVRILVDAGVPGPAPGWRSVDDAPTTVSLGPVARRVTRRRLLLAGAAGLGVVGAGAGVAYGMFRDQGNKQAGAGSPAPTPAVTSHAPGELLWQASSAGRPGGPPERPGEFSDRRFFVHDTRLVVSMAVPEVLGADVHTGQNWRRTVSSKLLGLYSWTGGILAVAADRVFLLDPATGTERWAADLATPERTASSRDNPDQIPVEISAVVAGRDLAFFHLGTATVALRPDGTTAWRRPRPPAGNGPRRSSGHPRAATDRWLVTQDLVGMSVHVGLFDAATGRRAWASEYSYDPSAQPEDGPPPKGPDGPGGPGGPGGKGPPDDEAWQRTEARIGSRYVVLRSVRDLRVMELATGKLAWWDQLDKPIASIALVGDLLLVGADRLYAFKLADATPAWQVNLRGARIAAQPDQRGIVVAADNGVTALDLRGGDRWHAPFPGQLREARPRSVEIQGTTAIVTLNRSPDQRDGGPPDILAYALGGDA